MTVIAEKELFELIKRAVSESLDEKLLKLKIAMIPEADEEEMAEIEEIFEDPKRYSTRELVYVENSL